MVIRTTNNPRVIKALAAIFPRFIQFLTMFESETPNAQHLKKAALFVGFEK